MKKKLNFIFIHSGWSGMFYTIRQVTNLSYKTSLKLLNQCHQSSEWVNGVTKSLALALIEIEYSQENETKKSWPTKSNNAKEF